MSTPFLGLRTALYRVPDLSEAKEWYSEAFGTPPYFDEPFYVGFNIIGYELGLLPIEGEQQTADNTFCYWGVDNIHQEYKRLLDIGAESHEEPTNVGGQLMVASVKDPWDNVIGMIYNPEFKLPD